MPQSPIRAVVLYRQTWLRKKPSSCRSRPHSPTGSRRVELRVVEASSRRRFDPASQLPSCGSARPYVPITALRSFGQQLLLRTVELPVQATTRRLFTLTKIKDASMLRIGPVLEPRCSVTRMHGRRTALARSRQARATFTQWRSGTLSHSHSPNSATNGSSKDLHRSQEMLREKVEVIGRLSIVDESTDFSDINPFATTTGSLPFARWNESAYCIP